MTAKRTIFSCGILCAAALLCGCDGNELQLGKPSLPAFDGSFSASADISYGKNTAAAEVTREEVGSWEFRFTQPPELSGVVMRWENGELTASLGELNVTAGGGDYMIIPRLIAEEIDSLPQVSSDYITEENGILTIRTSSCTITADKATGEIISLKAPKEQAAVNFSEISPYTEEVGVIDN